MKGRRISTQLTGTQCVESASVQRRQSEQINSKGCLFVKFRETILVNAKLKIEKLSFLTIYCMYFKQIILIETPCMYHVENIMYTNIK